MEQKCCLSFAKMTPVCQYLFKMYLLKYWFMTLFCSAREGFHD